LVFSLIEKNLLGSLNILVRVYEFIFQSLRVITNLFKAFKIAISLKFKSLTIYENFIYIKKRATSVAMSVACSYHNTYFAGAVGVVFLFFSLIENIFFVLFMFWGRAYALLDNIYIKTRRKFKNSIINLISLEVLI
jgi:hypothetical protein